jgi:hypothetical protein
MFPIGNKAFVRRHKVFRPWGLRFLGGGGGRRRANVRFDIIERMEVSVADARDKLPGLIKAVENLALISMEVVGPRY